MRFIFVILLFILNNRSNLMGIVLGCMYLIIWWKITKPDPRFSIFYPYEFFLYLFFCVTWLFYNFPKLTKIFEIDLPFAININSFEKSNCRLLSKTEFIYWPVFDSFFHVNLRTMINIKRVKCCMYFIQCRSR